MATHRPPQRSVHGRRLRSAHVREPHSTPERPPGQSAARTRPSTAYFLRCPSTPRLLSTKPDKRHRVTSVSWRVRTWCMRRWSAIERLRARPQQEAGNLTEPEERLRV